MRSSLALFGLVVVSACGFAGKQGSGETIDGATADGAGSDTPMRDAGIDAMVDAAPRPFCPEGSRLDYRFDGNTPCDGLGVAYTNGSASLTQGGGVLRAAPTQANSNAGCVEQNPDDWEAVIVELDAALIGNGNYTSFQLGGLDRALGVVNDRLVFEALNPTAEIAAAGYVAADMRWLQLRRDGGVVVAEYSPDGMFWKELARIATPAGKMRANVVGGYSSGTNVTGEARFDRLIVCDDD